MSGCSTDWKLWAPPLDPPTDGGLPEAEGQCIADAWWAEDPHYAAALMWESYAASLPPTPLVAGVSTGVQSITYGRQPVPSGEFGMAMARATWHRSLMTTLVSVPLVVAPPPRSVMWPHWWRSDAEPVPP